MSDLSPAASPAPLVFPMAWCLKIASREVKNTLHMSEQARDGRTAGLCFERQPEGWGCERLGDVAAREIPYTVCAGWPEFGFKESHL